MHASYMLSRVNGVLMSFCVVCRHLAESYSLLHATMAHPHPACDMTNDDFYENNGITNGADWYSVKGGISVFNC